MSRQNLNKQMTALTVVVPVFNRLDQLARALDSLVAQTDPAFDVIVSDDGSSEDIASLVDDYQTLLDIHLIKMPNSGGPARPRNMAVSAAKSEWLSFLDSDDWWAADRMARVKAELTTTVDIIYHRLQARNEAGDLSEAIGLPLIGRDPLAALLKYGNPFPTSATVVRRELFVRHGGFDESQDLASVEDFDLWLRLIANGARPKFIDAVLGVYWRGDDQISRFSSLQFERQKTLFEKQLKTLPLAYRPLANSHFNYLLGSYAATLGRGDANFYFAKIACRNAPKAWLKARLKMLWSQLGGWR